MTRRLSYQLGVSLLETLAASALAGFLAVVLVKLYQLSFTTYLQSAARLETMNTLLSSENILHRSLHLASTRLCGAGSVRQSLVHPIEDLAPFTDEINITQARSLRNGRYKIRGDLLTVHKTGPPHRLAGHNRPAQHFVLHEPSPFGRGDLLVVCDPQRTVLMQITGSSNDGRTLSYRFQSTVSPGNCQDAFISCQCGCDYTFGEQAVVALYQPLILFVSPRPASKPLPANHALFRSYLVIERSSGRFNARLHSEELVPGIVLARATVNNNGPHIKQLNYGIVIVNAYRQAAADTVYLFAQDVSSSLPAGVDETSYHGYEFSFSL